MPFTRAALWLGLAALLGACSNSGGLLDYAYPDSSGTSRRSGEQRYQTGKERETVFGEGGIFGGNVLGGLGGGKGEAGGAGIGVNSYLWRATLDTLAFMPLASADPFGGVIITDWYAPPETPSERFKMTVYILDRQLRADGIKVATFRQMRSGEQWVDASVAPETTGNLENAILRRARQLRSDIASQ